MKKILSAIALVIVLILPRLAQAEEERIRSFHADVTVNADSSMVVTETIVVFSNNDQIRRGIYRDFPTIYRDRNGARHIVAFDVTEVQRNGQVEPYRTESAGNGVRVYIGDEDVIIPIGPHAYQITYRTERQLGYFADHDELYWNVTGNGWGFEIGSASASVRLPQGVDLGKVTAELFTGPPGSTQRDGTWKMENSAVNFLSNGPLAPGEGLTIVVGWPKGSVVEPTQSEKFWQAVSVNRDYIIGSLGALAVSAFYLFMWWKRGRDPRRGTVIPQYESPSKLSPAMLRYVTNMGSDDNNFSAAIIDMAVKGALTITEGEKGLFKSTKYTLTKKGDVSTLSEEEKVLFGKLFSNGHVLELDKSYAKEVLKAKESFASSLKEQAGKKYFIRNTWVFVIGLAASIGVIALTGVASGTVRINVGPPEVLFWAVLGAVLLVVNIIFYNLIKAYTPEGRKLKDEIDGFKSFLSVTEKDRLNFHNPPEKTPQLFERMLPFALALGVEHAWAKQFASVFANLEEKGMAYSPAWYAGHHPTSFSADNFASSVGSTFSGVVSSSSTPPGSSSGSGGSSGGGGGGGGGGGW